MASLELWNFRRQLKSLDKLSVHPNSVISLLLPPKANLNVVKERIKEEYGKASNIKCTSNRNSVQDSLKSISEYLQGLRGLPETGLAIYFASHVQDVTTGEAGKLRCVIKPPQPVNELVYRSDKSCVTAPLWKLLHTAGDSVAYIIIDGSQATIALVTDRQKKILYDESVVLPRKHGRGGQSAARFGRIRMQAREAYVKKVAETARQILSKDNYPNLDALVVAGSAYLKDNLVSELSVGLKKMVRRVVTVAYRGKHGLNEAVEVTRDLLSKMNLDQTRTYMEKFFEHMRNGEDDMISYGEKNVRTAIEAGVVDRVLAWDQLPFTFWLTDNCMNYSTDLHIFHNSINETNMLVDTFGGVCAFHRHSFEIPVDDEDEEYLEIDSY